MQQLLKTFTPESACYGRKPTLILQPVGKQATPMAVTDVKLQADANQASRGTGKSATPKAIRTTAKPRPLTSDIKYKPAEHLHDSCKVTAANCSLF